MRNVSILGTGYVGLVTGACLAELGNHVTCVDVDAKRIETLRRGKSPFYEPGLDGVLERNLASGRISFTTDYTQGVADAEFVFLCLPTPSSPSGSADISALRTAIETMIPLMSQPFPIIVNKSTAPVGTCAVLSRLLERADPALRAVQVVSNPEFLREGSAVSDFMSPDRVVIGASDAAAAARVRSLYAPIEAPVLVTDPRTAELIKYASNAFLATKISFVNEIANICEEVGSDVTLVAEGMGLDKRIGKSFLRPGVGYGGSCFPKDVLALSHMAAMRGVPPRILRAVMEVNSDQSKNVLKKLREHVGDLEGAVIAIWGIAFKPDTDDIREAPAIEIMRLLEQEGASVRAYDPVAMPNAAQAIPGVNLCRDAYDAASGADAVLLLTEWREFAAVDLHSVAAVMNTPMLVDGRNVINPDAARAAGLGYAGVGRAAIKHNDSPSVEHLEWAS